MDLKPGNFTSQSAREISRLWRVREHREGVLSPANQNLGGRGMQAFTNGWWWKGKADIWWNDSAGQSHDFSTDVPVNLGIEDIWHCHPPDVPIPGQTGHAVKPHHGGH